MQVTPELVRAILDTFTPDADVPGLLSERLGQISKCRAAIDKIAADERSLNVRRARDREEIAERLRSVRKSCPHYVTTRHPGPNPGDSFRECETCGAEL